MVFFIVVVWSVERAVKLLSEAMFPKLLIDFIFESQKLKYFKTTCKKYMLYIVFFGSVVAKLFMKT